MQAEVKTGDVFRTAYGRAAVLSIRGIDGMCTAQLANWQLANGSCPKIYLPLSSVKYEFQVGDIVETAYGNGTVRFVRSDGMHQVTPTGWLLANNKAPVFYMLRDALKLYSRHSDRPEVKYAENMSRCLACKNEGSALYKEGKYHAATLKYFEALYMVSSFA